MPRPIPVEEMVRQFKGHHRNSHIFRIDNFSLFGKYQIQEIESSIFDIGGHKWKLVLFPNGNANDNGKDHVSLYLGIQDSESRPSNWQVRLGYQLFLLNQFRQDWRMEQGNVVFNASNQKRGFSRLMAAADFLNPNRGYLVDGCSLFGVKILGMNDTKAGTAECFTLVEKPPNNVFSWKMMKFSALNRSSEYTSDEFVIGDRKLKIRIFPQGTTAPDKLAVYLRGVGLKNNTTPKAKCYTRFRLRVLDKIKGKHVAHSYTFWFPVEPGGHGSQGFMPLKDLANPSNYVVNDTLYVEVEVDVISTTKYC
ncbi:PREDICTED: uncharacterized protein LOC104803718 [Tarenaya hassleriana]|uniref:uncharacterized protein LOC104803718 n=1 Tax=Tarenaya hassleriana TaxID=28532 RepID=UPI00053C9CD2|nr:PREDICTED: uncharacterized protein LOC104803718 [Tarenaya hassleriana]